MIVISPYAKRLSNGARNPKDYPHWEQILSKIKEPVVQVGVLGERKIAGDFRLDLCISELRKLIKECRTWVSCDSFFQHLAWDEKKPGIVLWGPSDPLIFGHPENVNLLRGREYLAPNQFLWWEHTPHDPDRFVGPEEVLKHLGITQQHGTD